MHRRLLKHPELPYFVVPHPIVSMSAEALQACADEIFAGIAHVIAAGLGAGKP